MIKSLTVMENEGQTITKKMAQFFSSKNSYKMPCLLCDCQDDVMYIQSSQRVLKLLEFEFTRKNTRPGKSLNSLPIVPKISLICEPEFSLRFESPVQCCKRKMWDSIIVVTVKSAVISC